MADNEEMDKPSFTEELPNLPERLAKFVGETAEQDFTGDESLRALMTRNFIEYSSYVVKERAIPDVDDGLKPVQRRILHTLYTVDDGRFNKVANVVGETMKYHPHGDQSIYEALIVLANKNFYIDREGNFGNIITGHTAAAGRYIECRLSAFAKETLFNPQLTEFLPSYDGRREEPVVLPAKVPSLLMIGSQGIAVGMTTHVLPHNFVELLQAEIALLQGQKVTIYPDFITGGLMDVTEYNDGQGSVRVRARIEADGDKRVIIKEVPAGITTQKLIESIEEATKKGKLKISSITDLTAASACIELALSRGVYAEDTIKALYAYTDCEQKITSNILVLKEGVPCIMSVSQVLQRNAEKLQEYLLLELQQKMEAQRQLLMLRTLERIFIEERIYKRIEKCRTLEEIFQEVYKGLKPHRAELPREVTDQDVTHLLAIPIRRISLFDLEKNHRECQEINEEIQRIQYNIDHRLEYTIALLEDLIKRYGDNYPRHTEITTFDQVDRKQIARRDIKVWHDRVNGFIGTGVKGSNKAESPLVCTEFDRLFILKGDGTGIVIPIGEKTYIGQAKYAFIYDKDRIYSILYHDKKAGTWYAKRFQIGQFILGKEYHIVPDGCVIDALYTNAGVELSLALPVNRRRAYNSVDVKFDEIPLRAREAKGFKLTSYTVTDVKVVNRGVNAANANTTAEAATESTQDTPAEPPAETPAPEATPTTPEPEPAQAIQPTAEPEKPKPQLHQEELPFFLE